jgi:hypothetical protein
MSGGVVAVAAGGWVCAGVALWWGVMSRQRARWLEDVLERIARGEERSAVGLARSVLRSCGRRGSR